MLQCNNEILNLYNLQLQALFSLNHTPHTVQNTHARSAECQSVIDYAHILNYPAVAGSARQQLFANALENDLDWSRVSSP